MKSDDDRRQRLFADLTALFEDAAELAARGQASGLTSHAVSELQQKLRAHLACATATLDQIT
jgi:hypothetical protein